MEDKKKDEEEDEEENKKEEKENKEDNKEEDKKIRGKEKYSCREKELLDKEKDYIFFEDENDSKNPPLFRLNNTYNYTILLNIEKDCFSPTPVIKTTQKFILKLMHFLLI